MAKMLSRVLFNRVFLIGFITSHSKSQTLAPSPTPSYSPTVEPTFTFLRWSRGSYAQRFQMGDVRPFNEAEKEMFEHVVENYTLDITFEDRINTTASVSQSDVVELRRRLWMEPRWVERIRRTLTHTLTSRGLQELVLEVDYTVSYKSFHTNVSWLPREYRDEVNFDLDEFRDRLNDAGLTDVTEAFRVESKVVEGTDPPSFSPTSPPSFVPSVAPTRMPSVSPTNYPTGVSTMEPTSSPSYEPTFFPSTSPDERSGGVNSAVIAVVVTMSSAAAIGAMFFFYKKRSYQARNIQAPAAKPGEHGVDSSENQAPLEQPAEPSHREETQRPVDLSTEPNQSEELQRPMVSSAVQITSPQPIQEEVANQGEQEPPPIRTITIQQEPVVAQEDPRQVITPGAYAISGQRTVRRNLTRREDEPPPSVCSASVQSRRARPAVVQAGLAPTREDLRAQIEALQAQLATLERATRDDISFSQYSILAEAEDADSTVVVMQAQVDELQRQINAQQTRLTS